MSSTQHLDALSSARKHNRQLVQIIYAVVALGVAGAWFSWRQPKSVDVHLAPDLRAGDTVRVSDGRSPVPPTNVYGFSYYIWQQINRWQTDGSKDYGQQIYNMQFYLTHGASLNCKQTWRYGTTRVSCGVAPVRSRKYLAIRIPRTASLLMGPTRGLC